MLHNFAKYSNSTLLCIVLAQKLLPNYCPIVCVPGSWATKFIVYLSIDQGPMSSQPLMFLTSAACWQVANLPGLTGGSIP